jgi:hypothetical protein
VIVTETCDTIADGLATRHPLEANVHAIRQLADEVRLVSKRELLDAIRLLLLDEHVAYHPFLGVPASRRGKGEDGSPSPEAPSEDHCGGLPGSKRLKPEEKEFFSSLLTALGQNAPNGVIKAHSLLSESC